MQNIISFVFHLLLFSFNLDTVAARDLTIGDDCMLTNETPGNCKRINDCSSALEEIKQQKHPKFVLCTFINKKPIICCQKRNNTMRISKLKCLEYSHKLKEFSCRNNKISQKKYGLESRPEAISHMAILGYKTNKEEIYWKCSGVLISEQFVLTVAICFQARNLGLPKIVRLGALDFKNIQDEPNLQDINVSKVFKRPHYNIRYRYSDIALLKLEQIVHFNQFVRPACLPNTDENFIDEFAISGWEMNVELKTHVTNYNDIQKISGEECNKHFINFKGLIRGIDNKTQICAIPNKFVCKMVVGSALQNKNKFTECMYNIHGLVSLGNGCDSNSPTVYTRIAAYVGWIENILWPLN